MFLQLLYFCSLPPGFLQPWSLQTLRLQRRRDRPWCHQACGDQTRAQELNLFFNRFDSIVSLPPPSTWPDKHFTPPQATSRPPHSCWHLSSKHPTLPLPPPSPGAGSPSPVCGPGAPSGTCMVDPWLRYGIAASIQVNEPAVAGIITWV